MHFEILVEDKSGEKALSILVPKIISENDTFTIHAYKGIGRIPKNLKAITDPNKRILLDQIPRLLKGLDKTYSKNLDNFPVTVIIVCDLDDKCLKDFKKELLDTSKDCSKNLKIIFCFAIEEGEAWFLGDIQAIIKSYPKAKKAIFDTYINDSICGTWEKLADAIYSGGLQKLAKLGYQTIGMEKFKWAEKISPNMDINKNNSPSFCYFRDKLYQFSS